MKKSVFAHNLREVRKKKGWSQEGAASTIGITRSLLASYETGRITPSHKVLLKITTAYQINNLHDFLTVTISHNNSAA